MGQRVGGGEAVAAVAVATVAAACPTGRRQQCSRRKVQGAELVGQGLGPGPGHSGAPRPACSWAKPGARRGAAGGQAPAARLEAHRRPAPVVTATATATTVNAPAAAAASATGLGGGAWSQAPARLGRIQSGKNLGLQVVLQIV